MLLAKTAMYALLLKIWNLVQFTKVALWTDIKKVESKIWSTWARIWWNTDSRSIPPCICWAVCSQKRRECQSKILLVFPFATFIWVKTRFVKIRYKKSLPRKSRPMMVKLRLREIILLQQGVMTKNLWTLSYRCSRTLVSKWPIVTVRQILTGINQPI